MADKKSKITPVEKRRVIREFLTAQLKWLDRTCLTLSANIPSGDKWALSQYSHFKAYRGNVKHLLSLNRAKSKKKIVRFPRSNGG